MSRWGPRGGGEGYDDGDDGDFGDAGYGDDGFDDGGYVDQVAFSDGEDPDAGFGGLDGTPSRRGPSAPPPRSRAPAGGRSQGPPPGRAGPPGSRSSGPSGGRSGGAPPGRAPPGGAGTPSSRRAPPCRADGPSNGGAPPRRAPPAGGRQQGRTSAGGPGAAVSRRGISGQVGPTAQRRQHGRDDEVRYLQTVFRNAAQELAFSITGPWDPEVIYEMRSMFPPSTQYFVRWVQEMKED